MWLKYAAMKPEQSWMVIHLLKDALFVLDRYDEFEGLLKNVLELDPGNIEAIANLADIYYNRGETKEAIDIIDDAFDRGQDSLLFRLTRMKLYTKEKQNPKIDENTAKQVSEFEKKELFDPNNIAALIDKSKEDLAETTEKTNKVTQSQDRNVEVNKLTLSEEDALKAQIFGCWSIPLGLPYNKNLLVRIKLKLKPDGSVIKSEILDHARMNKPGQGFYKVLAESALRAIRLCSPLRVPTTGYERWKDLQLNFDAKEMLKG